MDNFDLKKYLAEGRLFEKEGVPHYTKDGKEWKGKTHKMPDDSLMSGNPHDKDGSGPNGKSEKLFHKEDLNEMDMNDPVMMKMRAAKNKKPDFGKEYGDAVKTAYGNDKNAKKLAFLKKERAQLMRDMEQEAEPEGGPIADEYGSKLNRIDAAIAKLSGRKEMTYDQAIAENDDRSRVSMPRFVKDKRHPNFLNVYIDYDLGSGGTLIALGKETMTGQIRRESAAEAMRLAGDVARDLEAEYNVEDIDVQDLENGVVQVFAVSDDFIDMDPNILGEIKESISQTLAETIKLGEGVIEEELCPKGKAYIKRRQAAGEKSSAYLSGRAVKVCKGQMSGRKKKK